MIFSRSCWKNKLYAERGLFGLSFGFFHERLFAELKGLISDDGEGRRQKVELILGNFRLFRNNSTCKLMRDFQFFMRALINSMRALIKIPNHFLYTFSHTRTFSSHFCLDTDEIY